MRALKQTRTERQTSGKNTSNDGHQSSASLFVSGILLAVLPVSCPASQLCSPASYLKVSYIAFRTGLKHFLPLNLTPSASLSPNQRLPPQLLHVRQSNIFGTGESSCLCECFHFSLPPLFTHLFTLKIRPHFTLKVVHFHVIRKILLTLLNHA